MQPVSLVSLVPLVSFVRLEGQHSCVLIEAVIGEIPVWRHFGAPVDSMPLTTGWRLTDGRRLPPGSMDGMSGLPLIAGFGDGLPHEPALLCQRDGHDWVLRPMLVGFSQPDAQTVHFDLADAVAQVRLRLTLVLDAALDVLTLSTTLINDGAQPLQVERLASGTVCLPAALQEVGYFTGQWAHEFQWQRHAVPASGWSREARFGRSSHEMPPACYGLAPSTSEYQGPVVSAQLAWSGNHRWALSRSDDGALGLQAGEWFAPGELTVATGQAIDAAPLHVSFSEQGLDAAANTWHRLLRERLLPWHGGLMRPRPVHLNTWEAVYFSHEPSALRELATQAAAIGVERFVLDDGWFPARDHDRAGLGDWWPDEKKYPQGLAPLIDHVRSLGMEFGLWVEPEMVNPDSELYRAHPEWVQQIAGRLLALGRHQLVLDLTRVEVTDYLFDKLHALLTAHPIAYLKWDMNRNLAQAGNVQGRAVYRTQTRALYALLDRLRAAHPAVEIESCASGGGRTDIGILQRTHRLWTSDNNDALSRVAIQSSAYRMFPPEVLGSHVGPAPAHTTGRSQSLAFRAAVACFAHMGVEADVRLLSKLERDELSDWIAFHKAWRDVIHGGRFHQGRAPNGRTWWLAVTPERALLGVFTTTPPDHAFDPPLALPPLAGSGTWQVSLARSAGLARARGESVSPLLEALSGEGVAASGDELARMGLPVPTMNPESALIYAFERPNRA